MVLASLILHPHKTFKVPYRDLLKISELRQVAIGTAEVVSV